MHPSVAYVSSLTVYDDKLIGVLLTYVSHCMLQYLHSKGSHGFVKCYVRLVCYARAGGGINDGTIEGEHGIFRAHEVLGNLSEVCIESYTEEGAFSLYVFYEFLSSHCNYVLHAF